MTDESKYIVSSTCKSIVSLAACKECRGAGGAPIHPEQPCPGCGWDVFEATLAEDEVERLQTKTDGSASQS